MCGVAPTAALDRERRTWTSTALMPNARARRRGQSPAAAQRCAAGAGLDGDAALRSTIRRAVARNPSRQIAEFHQGGRAPGDLRYTKNLHQLDGHDLHLTAPLRPQPSPDTGLPQLPGPPFQRAVPNTPMGQNGCFCRLLPRSTRAFPVSQAGRRPSLHFRGLLRLYSRYGLLNCSTAHGGLCHEASVQPVARLNRSSATRSYRQLPGWILPPLVNRAVGAHCESRARAFSLRLESLWGFRNGRVM